MNDSLEESSNGKKELNKTIESLHTQVLHARKLFKKEHDNVKDTKTYLSSMKRDLEDSVRYIQDPVVLKVNNLR